MLKYHDLTGKKFNRLTVIGLDRVERRYGRNYRYWKCICDCGNETIVSGDNLKRGEVKSCGCLRIERIKEANTRHGKSAHPLYAVHRAMLSRCYNKNDQRYSTYGGRGITVCDEWKGVNGFKAFYDWAISAGWSDKKNSRTEQSIDRIDNNLPYSPQNCKLSTSAEQALHTTRSHFLTHNGETHTIAEWNDILGFPHGMLQQRITGLHWSVEDALTKPKQKNGYG